MTYEEYCKKCDDSYNYFKDAYERLTPEQRRLQDDKDRQASRDRSFRQYMTYLQERGYGSDPVPAPVAPKEPFNFADSQEVRATINHLEHRLNTHSHSKKDKEQSDAF